MSKSTLPLSGVRILDLSRVLAGPYCAMVLADMGADVIKIENPDGGDEARNFTKPAFNGHSIYFLTVNRNKRSVALDLKAPQGKAAFLKLVAKSDVVIENFRTGVMERLGLGYDVLKVIRPGLVYCAISGYGRDGPNVDVAGYDPVAQAESGMMSMTGEIDGAPMRTGPSLVDMVCGLFAAQAVSAALRHVALTGQGQLVEATLHETALNMLVNFAGNYLMTGQTPTRAGNTNQVVQPAGLYEAADGAFILTVGSDAHFKRLCTEVLQAPEIALDRRFIDNPSRVENGAAIRELLARMFAARRRSDWLARLRAVGIAAGAVATVSEALSSELVASRGLVQELSHTNLGRYAALLGPVRLHGSSGPPRNGAPLLGEHTREVLRDLAELSLDEIGRLEEASIARTSNA